MKPPVAGLYVITDARCPRPVSLELAVAEAIAGGAQVVQYRDKSDDQARRRLEALALAALCREHGVTFIVNDDVALAAAVNADGVHIGRNDAAIRHAREVLGEDALIGVSCYNDLDRARTAAAAGADYLAFGSIYPSTTKPDAVRASVSLLTEARAMTDLPLVAIGGINADNAQAVTAAGADALAVVDAVFAAADIRQAAAAIAAHQQEHRQY